MEPHWRSPGPARTALRLAAAAVCALALLLLFPCSARAQDPALNALSTAAWLYHNGHPEAAHLALRDHLQRDPTNLTVRLEYARMLAFAQNYSEALEQFQTVLRAEPANLGAQVGVAKVHSWQNRFSLALELYDQVLARAPGHYDATVGKAFTLLWMGRRSEAAPLFQSAARRNPQDKEVAAVMKTLGLRPAAPPADAAAPAPVATAETRRRAAPPSPAPTRVHALLTAPAVSEEPAAPATAEPAAPRKVLQAAVLAPVAGFALLAGLVVYRRRARAMPVRRRSLRLPAGMPAHRGRIQSPAERPLEGARILVVDGHSEQAQWTQMVLASAGAEPLACTAIEDAFRRLAAHPFDLVLLDSDMQGSWSAADLCHWMVATHPLRERRIILMMDSAPSQAAQRLAAESGALCLARPFTARDLVVLSQLALQRTRAAQRRPRHA